MRASGAWKNQPMESEKAALTHWETVMIRTRPQRSEAQPPTMFETDPTRRTTAVQPAARLVASTTDAPPRTRLAARKGGSQARIPNSSQ
jgi:hypothetical protein